MDFEFSDEQEQLRATVAAFLEARAPVSWVRRCYDDAACAGEVWAELADLGVTGLLVSPSDGGAGSGMVDAAVVLEELGRSLYPGPYLSSAVGAASLVSLAGNPSDRADLLPGLASGATIGTVALLEPSHRARWDAPTTRAAFEQGRWHIDGTKVHVGDAMAADLVLVTARDGDGRLGVFVVAADSPGVTTNPTTTIDGSRKQGTVAFRRAEAQRLDEGDAAEAVAATVDRLAAAAVVEGVGTAGRALEISVDYAKNRRQFDAPIGSFQAVQHLCADMLRSVELARAAGYYACWAADAAPPVERHRAATMALAFAADELYDVGASAVQVHGGVGFTWEHDIHLFYKRLLTLQDAGGGSVDQLEELASVVLGPGARG